MPINPIENLPQTASFQQLADAYSLSASEVSVICRKQKLPVSKLVGSSSSGLVNSEAFSLAVNALDDQTTKSRAKRSDKAKLWWASEAGLKRRAEMRKKKQ